MSQKKMLYFVDGISEISEKSLSPFPSWKPPEPGEIKGALQLACWTGEQFAKAVGVNPRSARRWISGEHDIPYAVWAVVCVEAGLGNIWQ